MENVKPGTHQSFWLFSLDIYQQADVEEICLSLQDQFGFNVNFILAALWAAVWQQPVTSDDFKNYQQQLRLFDTKVVKPLRSVRRAASGGYDLQLISDPQEIFLFKKQLLAAEIAAEKIFQEQLELLILNSFPAMQDRINASAKNVLESVSARGYREMAEKNLHQYALIISNKNSASALSKMSQLLNKIPI